MTRTTVVDVLAYRGNVVMREFEEDVLIQTHTMTPEKARGFAHGLLRQAELAEAMMPELRPVNG